MEFTEIGHTKKCHGIAGELKISIEEAYEDLFLSAERVYIEVRGAKLPYFIEQVRGGGELIVRFEDINNRDKAIPLQSKSVYLPTAEIPASIKPVETQQYAYVTGFLMVDRTAGEIGTIESIIDLPQQEAALIVYKGNDLIIPLHDHWIISIDKKAKRIFADLPEGMLDL